MRIKDVAKAAGVSVGTVDRVIHDRGNVAKDVEAKVKSAIATLGYRPNLVARSLAKKSYHKIAIILPNYDKDEYWMSQANGIQRALRDCKDFGLSGDLMSFDEQKKGDLSKLSKAIFSGEYEAVLIAPTVQAEAIELMNQCEQRNMPYVQVNSFIQRSEDYSMGYVGQDSYQSGQLAAKLLDMSSRDGAALGLLHLEHEVDDRSHLRDKEAGFRNYLSLHGQHDAVVRQITEFEDSSILQQRIEKLLAKCPKIEGLFTTTSRVNLICDVLIKIDRTDITLVGFDILKKNVNALENYKRLYLINQNPSLQGFYGVKRLFDHFLKQKSVKETLHLPLGVITLENVSNYNYMKARDNVNADIMSYE